MSDEPKVVVLQDDDRDGYVLRIIYSHGDFWLQIQPDRSHEKHAVISSIHNYSAGVRIRQPMAGGGSHSELWFALAKFWKEKVDDTNTTEK